MRKDLYDNVPIFASTNQIMNLRKPFFEAGINDVAAN
jgi:hypothetical protein